MKKKEIRTKLTNSLNSTLFELQVTPSKRIKKSVNAFARELAAEIKRDMQEQLRKDEKAARSKNKKINKDAA